MTFTFVLRALAAGAVALASAAALADDTIKVGLVAPFSGPFADYGKQMQAGINAYMKKNGDHVAGKKVEIIVRDTTGPDTCGSVIEKRAM